ncbi:MAG: terminase gpA endonuclease subunit [Desulfosalsimonas sp.]
MTENLFSDITDTDNAASVLPTGDVIVHFPDWLPEAVRVRVRERNRGRVEYRFRFSRAEKKVMRKRRKIAVSEWAEKHRYLTMSSIPGPWRNEVAPYLAGIMDAAQFPSVRVISVCKCPQSGVTEAIHNYIGWAIDQDPGPVLYTFPDRDTSEENARDRILPMIKSSKRLRSYMSGQRNDESMMRINLAHMPIYLSWASSPARLGNKPIKYAIADETDKYQARSKKETGPIGLIDKRLTTYRDVSKFFKISTPTTEDGIIWRAVMEEAEVVFYRWVKCPLCGRYQRMSFDRIKFGDCRDAKEMRTRQLAVYECAHCGEHWDDHLRNKAIGLGQWRAGADDEGRAPEMGAYLKAFRPQNIGFHLPAWESKFNSLSECAAAFLETLEDDPHKEKLKNFKNQICAEPWRQVVVEPTENQYRAAVCSLPVQVVPAEAVALTAGIDQQKYGWYFLVRAWARDYTSWMIHYGHLSTWEDLETWLFETSYPVDGSARRMKILRAAYDTGGGAGKEWVDQTMTAAAYMWIRKNGVGRGARVWGTKGASWSQANLIKKSAPFDKTPDGKPIPGGLQILTLDTEKFKDAFFYRLEQAKEAAPNMAAWLHSGVGADYFSHITAEHKVENDRGVLQWRKKTSSRRNDWLDCECMAAAAADPEWPEGGIHLVAPVVSPDSYRPRRQKEPERRGQESSFSSGDFQLPGWLRDR